MRYDKRSYITVRGLDRDNEDQFKCQEPLPQIGNFQLSCFPPTLVPAVSFWLYSGQSDDHIHWKLILHNAKLAINGGTVGWLYPWWQSGHQDNSVFSIHQWTAYQHLSKISQLVSSIVTIHLSIYSFHNSLAIHMYGDMIVMINIIFMGKLINILIMQFTFLV